MVRLSLHPKNPDANKIPSSSSPPPQKAPTAPTPITRLSARARRQGRLDGSLHPLFPQKTFRPEAAVTDAFLSTKRDKRIIRHSAFLSRVQSSSSSIKKPSSQHRRRRPRTKLAMASMKSLADALPQMEDEDANKNPSTSVATATKTTHRQRSLPSKPGALKRRQRIVRGEMERFRASMARLATVSADGPVSEQPPSLVPSSDGADQNVRPPQPPSVADRWAALRGYISATVEQSPAFARKS
ncbi:hypothetical protein CP532_4046 [Ophiocordyceps camponoti-leonardi (nom. inval.)]|nr:hypothetical protein CP532_4046 [Ophiocordyceps camponoti-leonardi (nom. inval.)]